MRYGVSNGHVTDDVVIPKDAEVVRSAILATAWLLVDFNRVGASHFNA